jgi:hypothetical protein
MRKVTISIDTENAAFDPWEMETARILRKIADSIEDGWEPGKSFDANGNHVATIEYED